MVAPLDRWAFSTSSESGCGKVRLASIISSRTSMPSRAADTSRIICRFNTESASCSPGVSMKTICPSGLLTMPWMRFRVVWGFEVTIATFCPTKRFSNVALPAFGRPIMATNPARRLLTLDFCTAPRPLMGGLCAGCRKPARAQPQHFALVRFENLEAVALEIDPVGGSGHFAEHMAEQACNRCHRLIRVLSEVDSQQLLHLRDGHAATQNKAAIRL